MVLIMNGSYNHNLESGWNYHMEIGCLCLHYYLLIWGAFALFQFFFYPYISTKLSEKLDIFLKNSDRFLFFYTIVLMFLLSIIVTITIAMQIAVVHDSIHNPYSNKSNPENTYLLVLQVVISIAMFSLHSIQFTKKNYILKHNCRVLGSACIVPIIAFFVLGILHNFN